MVEKRSAPKSWPHTVRNQTVTTNETSMFGLRLLTRHANLSPKCVPTWRSTKDLFKYLWKTHFWEPGVLVILFFKLMTGKASSKICQSLKLIRPVLQESGMHYYAENSMYIFLVSFESGIACSVRSIHDWLTSEKRTEVNQRPRKSSNIELVRIGTWWLFWVPESTPHHLCKIGIHNIAGWWVEIYNT